MILDRNKTALTHRITACVAAYLDGLGCKPVETEVSIHPGWIADVATYWYPTRTEVKRFKLHERTRELLFDADTDAAGMALRVVGHGPLTVVAEVKATKADFVGDRKWNQPFPANICILAYPSGMLDRAELPQGWYGLETTKNGQRIRKLVQSFSFPHPQHVGCSLDFVAQVGIRRDHRTRYRAVRDWWRAYNATENEQKRQYSAARLLEGLAAWLQGQGWRPDRSLDAILPELGVRTVPTYAKAAVTYFEGLRKQVAEAGENDA